MDVAGVYAGGMRLFVFCRVLKVYVDLCAVLWFFFSVFSLSVSFFFSNNNVVRKKTNAHVSITEH